MPEASPRGYPGHTVPGSPRPLRIPPVSDSPGSSWAAGCGECPTEAGGSGDVPGPGAAAVQEPLVLDSSASGTAPGTAPGAAPRAGVTPRPGRCHLHPRSHPEPVSPCPPPGATP